MMYAFVPPAPKKRRVPLNGLDAIGAMQTFALGLAAMWIFAALRKR